MAVGFFLVADDAIFIAFGSGFDGSILTSRILSLSIITVAYNNFIGLQVLATLGKEKITTISTICGAITNVVMNYFLIRAFQHNGAAVASATTECVVTLVQIILSARYIKITYKLKSIMISCIIMTVGVLLIKAFIPYQITRLIGCIVIGGGLYSFMMYRMKDSFAMLIADRVVGKIKKA